MSVRVTGIRELRRELRKLEQDEVWRPRLRQAGYEVATIVADEAQRTARAAANPRMGHTAAGSIRPLAGQTRASVAGGKASVPWYAGHEFGSRRFRQFPSVKRGGYHLYPAIERRRGEVLETYGAALEEIVRDAFPE